MLKLSQDTPLDLNVMTRRTGSATRSQFRTPARFPALCAKLLLTPLTSRSVRRLSQPSVILPTLRSNRAPLLLDTTPRLLLLMVAMLMVTKSVTLRLSLAMVTALALSARPRRTDSVTRNLSKTPERSPDRCVSLLPGRSVILLRLRYPDKSVITLDMESSMDPTMDMDMAIKWLDHLENFLIKTIKIVNTIKMELHANV